MRTSRAENGLGLRLRLFAPAFGGRQGCRSHMAKTLVMWDGGQPPARPCAVRASIWRLEGDSRLQGCTCCRVVRVRRPANGVAEEKSEQAGGVRGLERVSGTQTAPLHPLDRAYDCPHHTQWRLVATAFAASPRHQERGELSSNRNECRWLWRGATCTDGGGRASMQDRAPADIGLSYQRCVVLCANGIRHGTAVGCSTVVVRGRSWARTTQPNFSVAVLRTCCWQREQRGADEGRATWMRSWCGSGEGGRGLSGGSGFVNLLRQAGALVFLTTGGRALPAAAVEELDPSRALAMVAGPCSHRMWTVHDLRAPTLQRIKPCPHASPFPSLHPAFFLLPCHRAIIRVGSCLLQRV